MRNSSDTCKGSHEHLKQSAPSKFLLQNRNLLEGGRALDLAMGNGRNAIYLAGLGFEVEGVDISSIAVKMALDRAAAKGVAIRAYEADLEKDYHLDRQAYDLIICFNYLHRPLIEEMKLGVAPGGMVIYETFTVRQAAIGRPADPDHLLEENELLEMFRDFFCIRYHEGLTGEGTEMAGIIARKPAS